MHFCAYFLANSILDFQFLLLMSVSCGMAALEVFVFFCTAHAVFCNVIICCFLTDIQFLVGISLVSFVQDVIALAMRMLINGCNQFFHFSQLLNSLLFSHCHLSSSKCHLHRATQNSDQEFTFTAIKCSIKQAIREYLGNRKPLSVTCSNILDHLKNGKIYTKGVKLFDTSRCEYHICENL